MKYKEVKYHYKSGKLERHYSIDESGRTHGEYRRYHENGQLWWHNFSHKDHDYGEVKIFDPSGTLWHHYLVGSEDNELANAIENCKPATHTEEQLIEIAKEHNLPLFSEMPKTEAEVTLWNLKHPDCPLLPIESK